MPEVARAQAPAFELGAIQCLDGGEIRVSPPRMMYPVHTSGPEAVGWSPKLRVQTQSGWADYDTSAPWYQASTTTLGYGYTIYGRGFYGPQGNVSFVPFRGLPPGVYQVRNLLYWEQLRQVFFADHATCTFTGPGRPPPPTVPPQAPAQPAPPETPDSSDPTTLFGRPPPSVIRRRALRRGFTVYVISRVAGSTVSVRLKTGSRKVAYRRITGVGAGSVPVRISASRRALARLGRARSRAGTLLVTSKAPGEAEWEHRVRVRIRRR